MVLFSSETSPDVGLGLETSPSQRGLGGRVRRLPFSTLFHPNQTGLSPALRRSSEKFPFMAQAVLVQSGERRAVAVVAPRFEAVSRLWVLTGLKHQPPVFSRLPVQQGKGGSSQTASGLCLVRHSTCVRLALLVETNPCFLVQNFLGFWALQKRPVLLAKVQPNKFSCRVVPDGLAEQRSQFSWSFLKSSGASFL